MMPREHYSKKSHKGGRRHKGKGFFSSLKKGLKFVKDNGLISKGLQGASAIAGALGKKGLSESLGNHAETAENFGVGRRRHKRQDGAGFFDVLKKGFNFVKDNGLISKGLQGASAIAGAFGKKGLAEKLAGHSETAENFGVGRRHRKQKGQGFMDFLQPVMSLLGGRRGHHGKGLNMAGGHMYGNQEYPNSYHIHAHPKVHHARVHHGGSLRLAGEGVSHFGRINRGHSKMVIH
jgi:hypothetical protein